MTLCYIPATIATPDPVKVISPASLLIPTIHIFCLNSSRDASSISVLASTQQRNIMHPGAGRGANQSQWNQNNLSSVVPQNGNPSDGYRGFINDSIHSVDVPVQNPNVEDHEMLSWLHFPVDENYYSDWIADLPSSNVQIVKHSLNELGLQQGVTAFNGSGSTTDVVLESNSEYPGPSDGTIPVCQGTDRTVGSSFSALDEAKTVVAGADAVMTMNEGQPVAISATYSKIDELSSGGKLPGHGSSSVRMLPAEPPQPLPVDKKLQQPGIAASVESAAFIGQSSNPDICPFNNNSSNHVMLKPPETSINQQSLFGQRNFAHFSSPVAETKANLHMVGAASGPTGIERARQHNCQAGKTDLSIMKEKGRSQLMLPPFPPAVVSSAAALLPPLPRPASTAQKSETGKGKSVMDETFVHSYASSSGVTASNKIMEKQLAAEQTATSPSRMSGSSSEKSGKETAAVVSKRKGCEVEDSECQSEDVDEASNSSKKAAKRSRAAELHNLCERKRRDRINEKLMALRELMPNTSKTAKASILDEAIEYVKLLQSQLQAWSTRTGICIPPALMPNVGLHQLQMPTMPHVGLGMEVGMGVGLGMGMGMGMGIGMGLMDANTAAVMSGRAVMPILPLPQPSVGGPACGPQPCLPALGVVDAQPFNLCVPNQVQTASVSSNMHRNMELYHIYMQGQQQQQQQQQRHHHQLQQQQQQQRHHHQLQQQQQHHHHQQQQWHPYSRHLQGNNNNKPTQ